MRRHFIDLSPLWATGAIVNVALSLRSDGKTTAISAKAVQEFDVDGRRPLFCRRWGTEITNGFFDEFITNLNNKDASILGGRDYDFSPAKTSGTPEPAHLLLQPRDGGDKVKAIDFVPLSKAGRYKSSMSYKHNGNIYIDEYIPLDNRYLTDEMTQMLEMYQTVDRKKGVTRMTICGNRIDTDNPLFNYFGISKFHKGINRYQDGTLALLYYASKHNQDIDAKSDFNKLVRGTLYDGYNSGEFLHNNDVIISPRHSNICVMRISHRGKLYGVYQAGAALCVDTVTPDVMPSICVCIEPAPVNHYALWLDAVPVQRQLLERYKYSNAFFFANELIAAELKQFYKKI